MSSSTTNYTIIAPTSMVFAIIAIIVSCLILILISSRKQLHTVTHLLTCNTCISSILFCVVQCNNYIYLLFITWDTSDQSCRWRGYFGYMSIVAVVYSYLLQAISRFFFTILSTKYRWLTSLKTHLYLIFIGWIIVVILPLPAILTKDIYFREDFLCWAPKTHLLHVVYTIIAYYLLPIVLIVAIYISIYVRIKRTINNNAFTQGVSTRRRQDRDFEVLRNIIILFSIYLFGGIPWTFYIVTGIEVFYSIGVVTVTLAVTIEKFVSLFLDREIRKMLKKFFCHTTSRVIPMKINHTVAQY